MLILRKVLIGDLGIWALFLRHLSKGPDVGLSDALVSLVDNLDG